MKKPDLAKRMARAEGVSPAEAADRLDEVVRQILQSLRHGRPAALPGLGLFTRGPDGEVRFERDRQAGSGKAGRTAPVPGSGEGPKHG